MNKLKHEAELVSHALKVGAVYAKKRGVGEFENSSRVVCVCERAL